MICVGDTGVSHVGKTNHGCLNRNALKGSCRRARKGLLLELTFVLTLLVHCGKDRCPAILLVHMHCSPKVHQEPCESLEAINLKARVWRNDFYGQILREWQECDKASGAMGITLEEAEFSSEGYERGEDG